MDIVLEVSNLSKKYDNFRLDNISFKIKKGHIVGFIGTNGSGKSTTIKSILSLIKSDNDKIEFFGKKLSKDTKNRLAVVLDDGYFYETLKLEEMKKIVASSYSNWDEDKYKKLILKFKLNNNQKIKTLSKGMKMKFSIALALAHNAELIIMDEPTSGLDPLVRSELMDFLKETVTREKCSIFFSTHIISDLEKVADDIIFINNGKIIFEDTKKNIEEKYRKILKNENVGIEDIMLYQVEGEWNED